MKAVQARESVCHVKYALDIFVQHRFERTESSCKAVAMKTCIRSERKLVVWGLVPRKAFEATPSRTSENVLLQSRILIVFLLDLYVEKGTLISRAAFIEFDGKK